MHSKGHEAAHAGEHLHGLEDMPPIMTHEEVSRDVIGRFTAVSWRYMAVMGVLALLFAIGLVAFVIRAVGGFDDTSDWGYFVATMGFLTTAFVSAPIVSAGLRFTKAHWRRPLARLAEIHGVTALLVLLMVIPALAALPDPVGRADIWFDFPSPDWFPHMWTMIAMAALALCTVALLWMHALPDLANARDHLPQGKVRRNVASFLSMGVIGTVRFWRVLYRGGLLLGALYIMMYMAVQTILSAEWSLGMVPSWKDSMFPAYQVMKGLQAGTAVVVVTMFVLRTWGGYEKYFGIDQFWSIAKPLLAFSLLWFYMWFASFITFWYGRQPSEINLIQMLFLGPWAVPFFSSMLLNFLFPLGMFIWNPIRKSIVGPTVVAAAVLLGALIDQVRVYVAPMSLNNHFGHVLAEVPVFQWPNILDIAIVVGFISGAILLFTLVAKLVPVVSIWEVGEGLRLVKVRKFHNRWVRVIAKSH
ncbi:MAG: hypothetical protein FJ318_07185 [SAR202 cluster bacterium]|nr:hypothetical protein [SAR202 cluster bacterium]